jgi:sugar phosphate isomerase/epimerase
MHENNQTRRKFLKHSTQMALGLSLMGLGACGQGGNTEENSQKESEAEASAPGMFFMISLAQWSLNKSLFGGKLDNLDFARKAREDFGIEAIEYVNQFFADKAQDENYLKEMIKRADDNGVKSLLIMIDNEGELGSTNDAERTKAVENHYKWVDAAKTLGCHSIRVNAAGRGTAEEVAAAAVDGLGSLSAYAAKAGLNVIVENHGGYSSDGSWLSGVMKQVNMDNCGTLPDFGNFCIKSDPNDWSVCEEEYDRYQGVEELMPFAKAVSAKANDFDENGDEVRTDYKRILQIVKNAGYKGYIGIEYEGSKLSEDEGIRATKALLEKYGKELS